MFMWSTSRWIILIGLWLFAITDLRRDVGVVETFQGFPLFWRKPTYASSLETTAALWPLLIDLAFFFLVAMAFVALLRRIINGRWSPNEIGANVAWAMAMVPMLLLGLLNYSMAQQWSAWPTPPHQRWNDEPIVEETCDFQVIGWQFDVRNSPLFPQCRSDLGQSDAEFLTRS